MTDRRWVLLLAALAVAALAAVLVVVERGHNPPSDPVQPRSVVILPTVKVATGTRFERSLGFSWALSVDVQVPHGVKVVLNFDTGSVTVRRSRHLEEVGLGPGTLAVSATGGRAQLHALIISDSRDGGGLLLHRLAELHSRLRPDQFPEGADRQDRLHINSAYWTSGFWPGALWQAAALVRGGGSEMFTRWALAATLAHLGGERADSHDVGFEYGQSSLAGWLSLCVRGGLRANYEADVQHAELRHQRSPATCTRLKRSVLAAADELLALEHSNARAGTIPTDSRGPEADTIIDSMMNIAILPWAGRMSGKPTYDRVASRHAHVVARRLVRPDGSTAQVVKFNRASGRVLAVGTRQGLSASSTWSRGQGWAVYGFSQAALALHDRSLLRVALKTAGYVQRHLPPGGIPRWDYDAPRGAPVDVSAGMITAAGVFRLVLACHALPGVCGSTRPWVALGKRLLRASLAHASARPPLGLLSDQVLNEHGHGCWCNGGELIFGLTYGLEALGLERKAR